MKNLMLLSNDGSKKINKFSSSSLEETDAIGKVIAKMLSLNDTVCLTGDLGAGKTTLIKSIASEVGGTSPHMINSPTFTYLNIYEGTPSIYHFDCYRLKNEKEFLMKGLDEYFGELCFIEWPERIEKILPKNRVCIHIESLGKTKRKIFYEKNSL